MCSINLKHAEGSTKGTCFKENIELYSVVLYLNCKSKTN